MFKLLEYTNSKDYSGYSFMISNPYNEDEEDKHYCQLHIRLRSHSWYWRLPEFFKPQKSKLFMLHERPNYTKIKKKRIFKSQILKRPAHVANFIMVKCAI
jgi:hypothetical protein